MNGGSLLVGLLTAFVLIGVATTVAIYAFIVLSVIAAVFCLVKAVQALR